MPRAFTYRYPVTTEEMGWWRDLQRGNGTKKMLGNTVLDSEPELDTHVLVWLEFYRNLLQMDGSVSGEVYSQ